MTVREIELTVGAVAHGGHCVARDEGRVVFVRHALPGERVVARVTDDRGGSYFRADAVRVLEPSPDRVPPPCPAAGPGRCGGCDWQHATPEAQRALKAAVLRESLARFAGLSTVEVEVEELPGGPLGWRTRAQFAVDSSGRLGLRRHRRHTVQPVQTCLLAAPAVRDAVAGRRFPNRAVVDVAVSAEGEVALDVRTTRRSPEPAARPVLHERAAGRRWQVHAASFWQVHPAAADTLTATVLTLLAPRAGERALDLYAGVGVFAGALAAAVGTDGAVLAVESDAVAADDAAANLAELPQVRVATAPVSAELLAAERYDVAVLDPPRSGAGEQIMAALLAGRPRAVCYVACDPVALSRDLGYAAQAGYRLAALRAFDLFPMTAHLECVALLTR